MRLFSFLHNVPSLATCTKVAGRFFNFATLAVIMCSCASVHRTTASETKASDAQFTSISAFDSIAEQVADSIIRAFEITIEYNVQNDTMKNKHVQIKASGQSYTAKKHKETKVNQNDSIINKSRFSHSENKQERYRERKIDFKYPICLIILLTIISFVIRRTK